MHEITINYTFAAKKYCMIFSILLLKLIFGLFNIFQFWKNVLFPFVLVADNQFPTCIQIGSISKFFINLL
jgi:hypothetical protein